MSRELSAATLERLSQFLGRHIGLHFPPPRWRDLERGIGAAAREFGRDPPACIEWLLSSPLNRQQIEILAGHLTVGETYFYREKNAFEILERQTLPELIRCRAPDRRLRIWSAGCATGEEPYSIAMLLRRLLPDWSRWNICILATDINGSFLEKAARGTYGKWSFRDPPPWLHDSYFRTTGDGRYQVLPEIRKMVTFSHLNLAQDAYPSLWSNTNAMDLILCRNVLMYFTPEQQARVAAKLHRALVEGGWLIVSSSELSQSVFSRFVPKYFPGAIFYQKPGTNDVAAVPAPHSVEGTEQDQLPAPFVAVGEEKTVRSGALCVPGTARREELHRRVRHAEAAATVSNRLTQRENGASAWELLARRCANQGRLNQALDCCERALAADKVNVNCHYLRAAILQEQGALEEAWRSLERVLYLDPQFVLAHFALGNLALRKGRSKKAARKFEIALSLLGARNPEEVVPESEGMTAGRLAELIQAAQNRERRP